MLGTGVEVTTVVVAVADGITVALAVGVLSEVVAPPMQPSSKRDAKTSKTVSLVCNKTPFEFEQYLSNCF